MDSGDGYGLWVAVAVAGVLGLLVILQNLQMREGETSVKEIIRN